MSRHTRPARETQPARGRNRNSEFPAHEELPMKQATVGIVLMLAALSAAQTPTQPAPAQPGTTTGRAPIRAKTQEEYQAYQAAVSSQTPEAMEKAANDFATKFPTSDLRALLYRASMQ